MRGSADGLGAIRSASRLDLTARLLFMVYRSGTTGESGMLPKRTEWKRWGTARKSEYIGQVAVILTLFVTTVFSFLTWREARYASELQKKMFIAEKAPRVEVTQALLRGKGARPELVLSLTNTGGSPAEDACVFVSLDSWPRKSLGAGQECDEGDPLDYRFTLERGDTSTYGISLLWQAELSFTPTTAGVFTPDSSSEGCGKHVGTTLIVVVKYLDQFGGERGTSNRVFVCGEKPSAGEGDDR